MGIYYNSKKKTIAQIKEELGATFICNLNLFNMTTFKGCSFTKADGQIIADDKETFNLLGWNKNDNKMVKVGYSNHNKYENAFGCLEIVKDSQYCCLTVPDWASGSRPRTAIGIKSNGSPVIYCSQKNKSLADVAKALINEECVYAINVDGGGSTQCISPIETLKSSRIVHTLFYVVENTKIDIAPIKYSAKVKTTTKLNVRAKPTSNSTLLKTIDMGTQLDIIGKSISGNWYRYSDGWVYASYTEPIKTNIVTNVKSEINYIVKSGDSWWSVAKNYMGDANKMKELASYNNRTTDNYLKIGDTIKIPNPITNVPTNKPTVSAPTVIIPKSDIREKFLNYAEKHIGDLYVYGAQGEIAGEAIINWSARCFPQYTTTVRADRMKAFLKDHKINPNSGEPYRAYDCSGFVLMCLENAGLKYADTTAEGIYNGLCTHISKDEVREGDILFTEKLDHVGLMGRNGIIYGAEGADVGVVTSSGFTQRQADSIYGSKYGTKDRCWLSDWTKFGRIKDF